MKTLKIQGYFLEEPNIDLTKRDYTIIGLIKGAPKYKKGRKISASYYSDIDKKDLVVQKFFRDLKKDNKIIGIEIKHNFYSIDNTIGITTKTIVLLNEFEILSLKEKRVDKKEDMKKYSSTWEKIKNIFY